MYCVLKLLELQDFSQCNIFLAVLPQSVTVSTVVGCGANKSPSSVRIKGDRAEDAAAFGPLVK